MNNEIINNLGIVALTPLIEDYPKAIIMREVSIWGLVFGILILILYIINKKKSKNTKKNKILVVLSIFISFWLCLVFSASRDNIFGRPSYVGWEDPPIMEQIKECLIPGIIPFIIQLIIFILLIINIIKNKKRRNLKCQE